MTVKAMADATHAAKMDAVYRTQRHFYDLTRKYYLLGRDRLIGRLAVPTGGSVLEIGCGTGRNLIAVARRYPHARLFGLDISEAMLEQARANIARAGLDRRITLAQADACDFDVSALFGVAAVDRAFMSYTLSMIPDWRAALSAGLGALAEEGQLHVVDFGQQAELPHVFRRLLLKWLALFHVDPRAELFAAAKALAAQSGRQVAAKSLYRGYAWSVEIGRFG